MVSSSMKKCSISVVDYAFFIDLRSLGVARITTQAIGGVTLPGIRLVLLLTVYKQSSDRACSMMVVRVVVMKQFGIDLSNARGS